LRRTLNFYIEVIKPEEIKLLSQKAFDTIIDETVKYPIKQLRYHQPGPWEAYRYKDFWDLPGLGCNVWNRLVGAHMSLIQIDK